MNLRNYFRKIRDLETQLAGKDVVVCSRETGDGGREGVLTEVPAKVAGQLLVEEKARRASPEEVEAFRSEQRRGLREAEEAKAAQRIQVRLLQPEPGKKN